MAVTQHRETIEIPAGRGTIYDRTGEPLAIGEQATTVYADPRNVVDAQRAAFVAGKVLGRRPRRDLPVPEGPDEGLRLRRAQGRPAEGGRAQQARHPGPRLLSGGAPHLPAGPRRRARARLRRHRQPRARRARALARQDPVRAARASRRSSRIRSAARSTSSPRSRSGRARTSRSRSTTRSRRTQSRCSRAPWTPGARAAARRSSWIRAPARFSRWRTTRPSTRTSSRRRRPSHAATGPSPTPTSPARRSRS